MTGVKLIVALLGFAGIGAYVVKKRRDAQAEADLWHEATTGLN